MALPAWAVEVLYYTYQGLCPFVRIGSPAPPQASVSLPPRTEGEGQHSLAGEGVGDPIRTTGEKAWHSVYSVAWALDVYKQIRVYNISE